MNKECLINIKTIRLVYLLIPLLITGCFTGSTTGTGSGTPNSNDQSYTGYLVQVESDEQIEALLKSSIQQSAVPEEFVRIEAPSPEETDSISSDAYSETTLIENGINEMDLVKFDGDIIYQSHQSDTGKNEVRLLRVAESEASSDVVSTIQTNLTDNSTILGLYLYQKDDIKTLVILSQQYQYGTPTCGAKEEDCLIALTGPVYLASSHYVIEYYDVTTADSPIFNRSKRFKGSFLQSRRISNRLYTVSNLNVGIRGFDYGANSKSEIEANDTLLENISFKDLVPKIADQNSLEASWFGSQNCYVPEGLTSSAYQLQLTVITSSDLDTGDVKASCFLGYTQDFYASSNALYFSEGFDWQSKNTRIHQFDFNELGVEYAGSGTVIGRIGGKFKMSEQGGYLRVISSNQNFNAVIDRPSDVEDEMDETVSSFDEVSGAEHYLSILKKVENERELKLVSRIPNQMDDTRIGKDGESIFAVRFINDIAYVVTFLRTDPFYIIDISNPLEPAVTGKLEIPGFSTQLFPVNENYILGIGRENNLKLDLYDVSDMTRPILSSQYQFEASYFSPALYDHHSIAMLYDQNTSSMKVSLPALSYDFSSNDYDVGLYLFNIDASAGEISLNGSLSTRNNNKLTTSWDNIYDTRAIIDGENFHYVTPQPVYSAPWADPNDVSITP
jgi:uncharacterized secreted protein with C-terminal beta-propeller domain